MCFTIFSMADTRKSVNFFMWSPKISLFDNISPWLENICFSLISTRKLTVQSFFLHAQSFFCGCNHYNTPLLITIVNILAFYFNKLFMFVHSYYCYVHTHPSNQPISRDVSWGRSRGSKKSCP